MSDAPRSDALFERSRGFDGHADGLLVAAGSGAVTTGVPTSAGVPAAVHQVDSVMTVFFTYDAAIEQVADAARDAFRAAAG